MVSWAAVQNILDFESKAFDIKSFFLWDYMTKLCQFLDLKVVSRSDFLRCGMSCGLWSLLDSVAAAYHRSGLWGELATEKSRAARSMVCVSPASWTGWIKHFLSLNLAVVLSWARCQKWQLYVGLGSESGKFYWFCRGFFNYIKECRFSGQLWLECHFIILNRFGGFRLS